MADCGSSGTVLDRAAASLNRGGDSKHVSSLLGHVSMSGGTTAAMPQLAPTVLPQVSAATATLMAPIAAQPGSQTKVLDHVWLQPTAADAAILLPPPPQQHSGMMQHQHHMLMMQHQQMMMMQQHHHMMMQHQERQKNQQQMPVEIPLKSETTAETTNLDDWHEGLEDDLPQGITMDELAAAWAQAEAEYDAEVAVNMASVYHNDDVERPYTFTQAPPDKESVKTDWMKMGLEEYQRGNIKEAIRAFETQVQLQDDHSKAWYYLGKCHAENDQDVQAIACLERSVERDPFSPSTLLALGVSHVNELNHTKALQNLKEWITHNPEYAGLSVENDLYGAAKGESSELEQVQGLLLRALEHEPTPEVHEALGVVYNVSRDYDAAVASFRRALESRPQDYSLWNKLGATLANSNASSEALPAYSQALALRPKYARGWLNLAISHSNLHNYNEAARCYLQTLALNPDATHCWAYLRIALSCQEQWDLLPLVSAQDLSAFQEHYDFVLDKSLLKYG